MPYKYPDNIPDRIKGLPAEAQKIWIEIFNNAWEQYKDKEDQEKLANQTAWAGLEKAGWEKKGDKWEKTTQHSYIETVDIGWQDVFAKGTWNKDTYTDQDIDDLVEGTNQVIGKLKPFVKLGHDKDQQILQSSGLPAGGWITKLKRAGDRVMAFIQGVPKVLAEVINKGGYKRVSSEVIWNYIEPSTKEKFRRVLSAVAFLGSDPPAVTSLADIAAMYGVQEADVKVYEVDFKPQEKEVNQMELEELKKQYEVEKERLSKEIAELKETGEQSTEQLKILQKEKEDAEKKLKKMEEENKEAQEKARKEEIKTFITAHSTEQDMRWLPKHKETVQKLLESASEEKVHTYTDGEGKETKVSQRELLEKFLETQPNFAEGIFKEYSQSGEGEKEKTAVQEVDKKVKEMLKEDEELTYGDALKKLQAEEPELVKKYQEEIAK